MEVLLDNLVKKLVKSNNIQQEILDKIKGLEGTINRKFIVKMNDESCCKLLSENLTRTNVNRYNRVSEIKYNIVHKVKHNNKLNHICICFNENRYLEVFIIPIEKDISEIHINGINIQMGYFQEYLQLINNILKK